jgi:hypothetical protein
MDDCAYTHQLTQKSRRFSRELLGKITGSDGDGPLYTYIHKVSLMGIEENL